MKKIDLIEKYLIDNKIIYDKNIIIDKYTVEFYLPKPKIWIVLHGEGGSYIKGIEKKLRKARPFSKVHIIKSKKIQTLKDVNINGCSISYLQTGIHPNSDKQLDTDRFKQLKEWSNERKKNYTSGEKKMERFLIKKKIRYEREYPFIGNKPYIFDYFLPDYKIIIEVDGGYHKSQIKKDIERDCDLRERGFRVFRLTNEEVDKLVI